MLLVTSLALPMQLPMYRILHIIQKLPPNLHFVLYAVLYLYWSCFILWICCTKWGPMSWFARTAGTTYVQLCTTVEDARFNPNHAQYYVVWVYNKVTSTTVARHTVFSMQMDWVVLWLTKPIMLAHLSEGRLSNIMRLVRCHTSHQRKLLLFF